jgi:hypothetical protein
MWSYKKAAAYGAIIGALFICLKILSQGEFRIPAIIGGQIGGALAGAGMFLVVAWIRNTSGGHARR